MSNRLIINPGTPQAWEIQLKPGLNRIGRGEDNDFVINHQSVSTHHCEVAVTDAAVTLRDLGSTNGTFVERVPVTEIQLHTGHHVQFGSVGMVFESVGLPPLPDAVNLPGDGAHIMVANPTPAAPPPPPMPPGLRINRPGAGSTSPTGPQSLPPSLPAATTKAYPVFDSDPAASDRKSILLGSIGAIVGGLIGMFVWYYLIRLTEREIGWIAWGVGGLTGFAARIIAKRGSPILGIICGACAMVAIIGGTYLAALHFVRAEMTKLAEEQYQSRMHLAQAAVNAKTTEEIKAVIASEDNKSPDTITDQQLKEFQEEELPELREFANGKPSKAEYTEMLINLGSAFVPKMALLKETISLFTLLWLFLGVGTAYKIGSGHND